MSQGHSDVAIHRDYVGAKIGMWLFLFTELLLFGGLFLAFLVYRSLYLGDFAHASDELNVVLGTFNTVVLLTSSLTMVLAVTAMQKGKKKTAILCLLLTMGCALGFMAVKYVEWSAKIHHGIYPNSHYLLELPRGQALFFGLYYTMTGLHAFHVFIGVVVLAWITVMIQKDKITQHDFIKLENAGLYWHLVDLIWIYLFPLLYLVG